MKILHNLIYELNGTSLLMVNTLHKITNIYFFTVAFVMTTKKVEKKYIKFIKNQQ